MPKITEAEKAARTKQFKADYPQVLQGMELRASQPGLSEIRPVIPYRDVASALGIKTAGSVSTFWPFVPYYQGWSDTGQDNGSIVNLSGVYSLTPSGSLIDLDSIKVNTNMRSYGGAAVVDGVYYKFFIDTQWLSMGYVTAKLFSYDISTWQPTETSGEDMSDHLDMLAIASCQSTDGTVYGQFYTSDLSTTEYGIVDYKAKTRSVIGTPSKRMVAMGMGNDGTWYGIAKDGNLYTISKDDGTETLIGATGLTLTNSEGGYYLQSGCIDPKTNTFFWCPVTGDLDGGVYTVDLTTGAATKVGDFAGGNAQIYDMIVEGKSVADAVPARAENLTAVFPDGGNNGTISFTAPTRDYADSADLSGELSYTIIFNNKILSRGSCAPGANVSDTTTATKGINKIVVVTANSAGTSPKATLTTWVGYDIPVAPDSVKVTWADDNSSATVSWDAVTEGIHYGYLGPITYRVVRVEDKDTAIVTEATTATTLTDVLLSNFSGMANTRYLVRAINGPKMSVWTSSDGHVVGEGYEVPYLQNFDDEHSADFYTIIDANEDDITWRWYGEAANPCMRLSFNSTLPKDDWLFTPPIRFNGGRMYTLSFKSHGDSFYPEKMEVKYGDSSSVESMTNEILPVTIMANDTIFNEIQFTPSSTGYYYLGFHACSDKNMFWTMVDSIDIELGTLPTSPIAPEFNVTPGAKGALTATLDITAPTKAADGSDLAAGHLTKIEVLRGYDVVHVFENPAPGQVLTFVDAVPKDGTYTWTVTPYDGDDYGKKAQATAYIGQDKPMEPKNALAVDNNSSVHISWDAITETGATGGYVDPADVKTLIYNVDGMYLESTPLDTVQNVNYYDIAINTNEGKPELKHWGLVNQNRVGKTEAVGVALPVGAPYTLPFYESVTSGDLTYDWWIDGKGGSGYTNRWMYTTKDAADNDGGSFVYTATDDSVSSSLNSYKINLAGATSPILVFSYNVKNSTSSTKGKLEVEVQTLDGASTTVFNSEEFVADQSWSPHVYDLSNFIGRTILVKFHTSCFNAPVTIGIDKIRVLDTYTDDLSAEINAPASVVKGQAINAIVKISNEGTSAQNAYTVKVYADNNEVSSIETTEKLDPFNDRTFAVSIPTSAIPTNKTEKVIKAQVVLEGDLQAANNIATATVATAKSDLPSPVNLQAADAQPHVLLTWEAPARVSMPFTDDFESYSPFAVNADGAASFDLGGGWTTIDGQADQTPIVYLAPLWQSYAYPGQEKAGSFMVFNATQIGSGIYEENECLHGHNDSYQFAGIPYEYNGNGFVEGDNYLVSPSLTGEAQTISFYAKNALIDGTTDYPESFELLYSTTGKAKEDFTNVVIADTTLTGGEWQYFEANLPANATYFAIHQTSSTDGLGDFLFSVDDVTYLKGIAKPTGYNVYCDGTLAGHVDANGVLEFYGDAPEGSHGWYVTACYPDGQESEPVSVTVATDISSIKTNDKPFDVYTIDGILVRSKVKNVKDLKAGVYIINNTKVIIK